MARYTQDVVLNKPDDFVQFMMNDYLQKESFSQSDWKGAPAYRRGDGFIEGFRYLTWSYNNGVLHLEAWLKGPFGGEQDLSGFWGWAVKSAYRSSLEGLIKLLHQDIPQPTAATAASPDGSAPNNTAPVQNVVTVQTTNNTTAATLALILGIVSIVASCFIPLIGLVCGFFAIIFYRSGKGSTSAGQAKAGRVCGIIGICLAGVMWILNIVLTILGLL